MIQLVLDKLFVITKFSWPDHEIVSRFCKCYFKICSHLRWILNENHENCDCADDFSRLESQGENFYRLMSFKFDGKRILFSLVDFIVDFFRRWLCDPSNLFTSLYLEQFVLTFKTSVIKVLNFCYHNELFR